MPANWRNGFTFAWHEPDPEPAGPGLVWRETSADYWSGSWASHPRGTVMLESSGHWVAYLRLEDPAGLSPITQAAATTLSRRRRWRRTSCGPLTAHRDVVYRD